MVINRQHIEKAMYIRNGIIIAALAAPLLFYNPVSAQIDSVTEVTEGIFEYHEIVGEERNQFNWEVEQKDEQVIISVSDADKSFYNVCTEDGATLEWRIEEKGVHDITVTRKGDTLHLSGIRFGEEYNKEVSIDERPWYQPLSFSLRSFLSSDEQKTSFWVVRADKIDVMALTAEKVGEEDIIFNGEAMPSQKVEIRAEGFRSSFWHGTYWYRISDNLFLRYESVHGLPGTATTIVELVGTPQHLSDS